MIDQHHKIQRITLIRENVETASWALSKDNTEMSYIDIPRDLLSFLLSLKRGDQTRDKDCNALGLPVTLAAKAKFVACLKTSHAKALKAQVGIQSGSTKNRNSNNLSVRRET